jgi:hypothetical protein
VSLATQVRGVGRFVVLDIIRGVFAVNDNGPAWREGAVVGVQFVHLEVVAAKHGRDYHVDAIGQVKEVSDEGAGSVRTAGEAMHGAAGYEGDREEDKGSRRPGRASPNSIAVVKHILDEVHISI